MSSSDKILSEASLVKGNNVFIGGIDHVLRLSFTGGRVNSTLVIRRRCGDTTNDKLKFLVHLFSDRLQKFRSATPTLFDGFGESTVIVGRQDLILMESGLNLCDPRPATICSIGDRC